MNNTKIKICGLYRDVDIDYANKAEPDFIGFIFYEKSHRFVTPSRAKEMKSRLSKKIKTVGVFVNKSICFVAKTTEYIGLDVIQLHGDEDNEYILKLKKACNNKNIQIWKAIRIKENFDNNEIEKFSLADKIVADTYVEGYGGEGKRFNLELIRSLDMDRIILAGGLNPDNISEVLSLLSPYGIDVSSGVETDKKKDCKKMIEVVQNITKLRCPPPLKAAGST